MTSTYGAAGLVMDRYSDILARYIALAEEQWSDSVNTDEDQFLGHILRNISLLQGEINEIVQSVYDAGSIANSTGVQLANNVALIGLSMQSEAYSTVTLSITATLATTVQAGSRYATAAEVIFETDEALVFTAAGSQDVAATCTVVGANEASAGTITTIKSSVYGISAVTNAADAIPGRLQETPAELKERHTLAVATSGDDDLASILEAVSSVTGVSAYYGYDNDTAAAVGLIPAHTIRISVIGGADADIAAAIANNKTSGVPTYGAQSDTVYNTTTRQTKTIYFDRAVDTPVHISMTLTTIDGVFPDDGVAQMKAAMVAHFADINIDGDVPYNSLYRPIYSVPGHSASLLKTGTVDPPAGVVDLVSSALIKYTLDEADIDITVV